MNKNFLITLTFITIIFTFNNYAISSTSTTITQHKILDNINQFYNKNPIVKSKFQQVDSVGKVNYGWFIFDKKNHKARIEYIDIPLRIIVNNKSVMIEQIDLKEKTFTPLVSSPFKYILSQDLSTDHKELNIDNITINNNNYEITLNSKQNSLKGSVTLIFNKNYHLAGWSIIDELGNTTYITLQNPTFSNQNLPNTWFNTHKVINIDFNKIK